MTNSEAKYKLILFYAIAILFIITNSLVILKGESFLFNLVPLAIIIFLAMFFTLDKVLLLTVFMVPFSVPLKTFVPGLDFNIDLTTEPIFVGILLRFLAVEQMAVVDVLHRFDEDGYVAQDSLGVHIFRCDQIAGYPS